MGEIQVPKWKSLLQSRMFWASVIGILLMFILAVFPSAPDVTEQLTELFLLIAAYVLGSAIDPAVGWQNKLLGVLKSRKFWSTGTGLCLLVLRTYVPDFPIPDEQISFIVMALATYTFGVGLQDKLKL